MYVRVFWMGSPEGFLWIMCALPQEAHQKDACIFFFNNGLTRNGWAACALIGRVAWTESAKLGMSINSTHE